MTKEWSTEIVYSMTSCQGLVLGRGHIGHIVKMYYFLRNMFLYSGARFRQTMCIVMMSKEGSTKKVNFMTLGTGVFVLGRGLMSCRENVLFLLNSGT